MVTPHGVFDEEIVEVKKRKKKEEGINNTIYIVGG